MEGQDKIGPTPFSFDNTHGHSSYGVVTAFKVNKRRLELLDSESVNVSGTKFGG
jgi:hypothetical protein